MQCPNHTESTNALSDRRRSDTRSAQILKKLLLTFGLAVALALSLISREHGRSAAQGSVHSRFAVEIDGVIVDTAGVDLLDGVKSDVVAYRSGGSNVTTYVPGNKTPGKIVLSKDWSNTSEWYNWRKTVIDGKVDRKSISVIFHNDAGEEAGRINLYNCWPSKWVGPSPNARSSAHATEKLEISYETIEFK